MKTLFILAAELLAGFGFVTHATAQERAYYLIDLDSRTATKLENLGGVGTDVTAINDAGQLVGYSKTPEGITHAFITGRNGVGMTGLNSLVDLPDGFVLTNAVDINNAGQVIAIAISEPEIYAMLLTGLGLIGFSMRRKKAKGY